MAPENPTQPTPEETTERIDEIEARLIAQEHRPLVVIQNYLAQRSQPKGDPRRKAATAAIVWRLFFSPATLAATGGIVAVISLFVLVQQNGLLEEQNELVQSQNQFFQRQILQEQEQFTLARKTDLLELIYDGGAAAVLRENALLELLAGEGHLNPRRLAESGVDSSRGAQFAHWPTRTLSLKALDFPGITLSKTKEKKNFAPSVRDTISFEDLISNFDPDGLLSDTLVNIDFSGVNWAEGKFANKKFFHCDFSNAQLQRAHFEACKFYKCKFSHANLRGAQLSSGGLESCEIDAINLTHTEFKNVNIDNCNFYSAKLDSAQIEFSSFNDCRWTIWGNALDSFGITPRLSLEGTEWMLSEPGIAWEELDQVSTGKYVKLVIDTTIKVNSRVIEVD